MNTMRQFRLNRTNASLLGLAMAGVAGISQAAVLPLAFHDEDVDMFSTLQITGGLTSVGVQTPMLCANTDQGVTGIVRLNPVTPGVNGSSGTFKFGDLNGGETATLGGIASWNFRSSGLKMSANPGLVCYVLSDTGVRKASLGLFTDTFESAAAATPNAFVLTRVLALPDHDNAYYKYLVDMTIPAEFVGKKYSIRDGFDSSVFDVASPRYCEVSLTATSCTSNPTIDNVDFTSIVPAGGVSRRFVVQRLLRPGVFELPANPNLTLTAAGLFIGDGQDESNLADNVSVGRAVLSDMLPVISADNSMVGVLTEGSGATDVRFVISDDTSEVGMPTLLNATVTLDFNGNLMPATNLSCAQQEVPQNGEAVRRTCRFDIPVFHPDFATDSNATPGTYVQGVQASIRITATDSRNQSSLRVVPFHIVSNDNDAPSFSLSPIAQPDRGNGDLLTVTCDLSAPPPYTEQCLGNIESFVLDRKPGSPGSADENATQVAFFAGVSANNKLNCTNVSSPSIFTTAFPDGLQSPKYVSVGNRHGLQYQLSAVPGFADCWVVVGDSGYTGNQGYNQSQVQVRFKVIE